MSSIFTSSRCAEVLAVGADDDDDDDDAAVVANVADVEGPGVGWAANGGAVLVDGTASAGIVVLVVDVTGVKLMLTTGGGKCVTAGKLAVTAVYWFISDTEASSIS